MSEHVKNVSDASFDTDVLQSDKPVLVDFWADWCNPCKAIAPFIEEVAAEYGEKVTVVKVDTDENKNTPERYGVLGIPTLIVFKSGEIAARHTGVLSKAKLVEFLDANV